MDTLKYFQLAGHFYTVVLHAEEYAKILFASKMEHPSHEKTEHIWYIEHF